MSVSAVIRAYNEAEHLGRLLTGLQMQTQPVDEVILVDSGSDDNTVRIAEAAGCKLVHIAKDEFTFGRSLNRGCEAAQGDLLLFASAHVYPLYDTYVEHLASQFVRPKTAVAYGRQVGDHRTTFSESRILRKWFPQDSIRDQAHPFSNNANCMVRKSVWEQFRYNETLTGLEDLDFAKRAIEGGYGVAYVAESPVVHVHEETWHSIKNRYRREAIAYKRIMHEAEFTTGGAVSLAVANIAGDYYHALREGKLAGNIRSIPKFRIAQFLGAIEGFKTANVNQNLLRRFYYPADAKRRSDRGHPGRPIKYDEGVSDSV